MDDAHNTVTHLLFLPERANPRFFLWEDSPAEPAVTLPGVSSLAAHGVPATARILDQSLAVTDAHGTAIPLFDALSVLATMTTDETEHAPASVAAWSFAAKLALELVGRERIVPVVQRIPEGGVKSAGA